MPYSTFDGKDSRVERKRDMDKDAWCEQTLGVVYDSCQPAQLYKGNNSVCACPSTYIVYMKAVDSRHTGADRNARCRRADKSPARHTNYKSVMLCV